MADISWSQAFFGVGTVLGLCVLCWIYGYVEGREAERNGRDEPRP
jgi:hypothetical protein